MIEFKVSAPGRLSLFGEHAVLLGKNSITVAINLRTTLTFTELQPELYSEEKGFIRLEFPQIYLFLSIPMQQFLEFYRNCEENMEPLHEQVQKFVIFNYPSYTKENNQRIIVQAFVYLLAYISRRENINIKSFVVCLSTELMIDAEFFCPASFTVCFAACFLHWSHLQKGAHNMFDDSSLKKIYLYAVQCEKISIESGRVDVTVCTYGSITKHQFGEDLCLTWLSETPNRNTKILLIDTQRVQNPDALMQRILDFLKMYREIADSIFNNIDAITCMAYNAFQRLSDIYRNSELDNETKCKSILQQHNVLMASIRMNQKLLNLLNLSHYQLDEICTISQNYEFYGKIYRHW